VGKSLGARHVLSISLACNEPRVASDRSPHIAIAFAHGEDMRSADGAQRSRGGLKK
jgi:hypothetical protein